MTGTTITRMPALTILSRMAEAYGERQGRALRKYFVDGINTIGVWGEEPCSIRVGNPSNRMIQARISIDGTDILTGALANIDPKDPMFIIQPFHYMERKTWPESHRGGGQFVFTPSGQSVAAHTHGDITARGYISCAIFVEGYVPPKRKSIPNFTSGQRGSGQSIDVSHRYATADPGPGMGVGVYEEEHLTEGKGLIKPVFSHILQVRYLWWDDLEDRLRAQGYATTEHPTGFQGINLGSTPRLDSPLPAPMPASYSRFQ